MKIGSVRRICLVPALLAAACASAGEFRGESAPPDAALCLWYRRPATNWSEALPIGSGHIAGMVFGDPQTGHIQFNEHTVWTGRPHLYARTNAVKFLPEIRRLLQEGRASERPGLAKLAEAEKLEAEGKKDEARARKKEADELLKVWRAKQKEADDLALREFMSDPLKQKTYQPCGDLWIEQPAGTVVDNYRRWLDLDAAVCVSDYRVGDVTYTREAFASHPARAIVARLRADKPGRVDCRVRLSSVHRDAAATVGGGGRITLRGQVEEGGIRFEAVAQVEAKGGTVTADGDAVRVTGADEVVVRLVAATNFRTWQDISGDPSARCADLMKAALAQPFGALLAAHQADHRALFRRVAIDLGRKPAAEKPTDERIAAFRGGDDPHLAALVFQYGCYLLIGASRAGGQPANLQGIWNDLLKPTWDSKYTCNINTEMNYWPALSANLAECQTPLFDALDDLAVSGVVTAKEHYGAHGWVVHHNFDLWRGSAPINAAFHGDDPLVHRRPPGRPSRRDDGDLRHETRCRGRSRCGPAQGAVARNGERRPEESVKSHKDDFVAQSEAASRLQRRVHAAYTNAIATTRCAAGGHPGARGAPKAKWAERTLLGKPGKGGAMLRFVAFLRGVNPMNAKMVELKRCFEGAGFTDVKTVLSSGNVVFNARAAPEAVLERKAEATMAKQLGRTFHTIMRPADVLHELIEADPYATFRLPVNAKRVVTFLREPHTGKLSLPIEVDGACILAMNDREVFTAYVPNPRGPVFMTLIEKAFGTKVTTRTWDTVKKCATA